jgi:zinc transport system substrate-binding protein
MNKSLIGTSIFLLAFALFAGGAGEEQSAPEEGLAVFVSILPQKYFVDRIGGQRVRTSVMVRPGKSPATYEPTPRQMVALGNADLFITIGVPFEDAFLPSVTESLPDLKLVRGDEGIRKRRLDDHAHDADEDEDGHDEAGAGAPDPHIWMDPVLVKGQALLIRDALVEADPAGTEVYRAGYESFAAELDELHGRLSAMLAPLAGSVLFVYHPSLGYFADRYGFDQIAIETGGKEPSADRLQQIVARARAEGIKVIFVQPEFPVKSAAAVAEAIDGVVVPLEPLRERYSENLMQIAESMVEGLGK